MRSPGEVRSLLQPSSSWDGRVAAFMARGRRASNTAGGAAGSGTEYIGTRIGEHLYQETRPGVKVPCVAGKKKIFPPSPQTKLARRCISPGAKAVKNEPPAYPSLVPRSGTKFLCLYLSLVEEYYNPQRFLLRPRPEGKPWRPVREQGLPRSAVPLGGPAPHPQKLQCPVTAFCTWQSHSLIVKNRNLQMPRPKSLPRK